jgi:hypothetical protein
MAMGFAIPDSSQRTQTSEGLEMFKFKISKLVLAVVTGLLATTGQQARADFTESFSGSGTSQTGVPISATADFSFNSATNTLTITLTNTSGTATTDPGSTLTGLYFNLSTTLTPVSAALGAGAFLVGATQDKFGATQVGQGWAYGNSGVVPPSGDGLNSANTGIISTGYGSFPTGTGNFAAPGVMLDGVAWGIIPDANGTTALNGGSNNAPVVNHSIVFTLTSPTDLNPGDITGVEFAYGTGNGEGGFLSSVPVPPSAILLAIGSLGIFGFQRRIRRGQPVAA